MDNFNLKKFLTENKLSEDPTSLPNHDWKNMGKGYKGGEWFSKNIIVKQNGLTYNINLSGSPEEGISSMNSNVEVEIEGGKPIESFSSWDQGASSKTFGFEQIEEASQHMIKINNSKLKRVRTLLKNKITKLNNALNILNKITL